MYTSEPPPEPSIVPWVVIQGDTNLQETYNCPFLSLSICTDGSKMEEEKERGTSCGVALFPAYNADKMEPVHRVSASLCHGNTVFIGEMIAIQIALLPYQQLLMTVKS